MIRVPRCTMKQDGVLLCLPPRAQCHCHCRHSQLLQGVQAPLRPTGIPSRKLATSSAAPGHLPAHLVSDEPQHGQGLQGNLKLHHLCLLLQLLWRDRISLGISGPIFQELQGGRLLTILVTTVWVGKQSPEKQCLVSTVPSLSASTATEVLAAHSCSSLMSLPLTGCGWLLSAVVLHKNSP